MISRFSKIKPRTKPREGRVKGKAMKALREACYERDGHACVECGVPVTWEGFHMAHIGAKRRHGDSLGNVRTLCPSCHFREHSGGKPVKSKSARSTEEGASE